MNDPLQPYYHNGLLFLPEKLIKILLGVGLEWRFAHAAARGIAIDDEECLGAIYRSVQIVLQQLPPSHPLYTTLNGSETRFMLTGRPA
jgi:hypothetical protein